MTPISKLIDSAGGPAEFGRMFPLISHKTIESWRSKGPAKRGCKPWLLSLLLNAIVLRSENEALKQQIRRLKLDA